jgi:FMN phosphatase YigB (HAD superfamily)
VHVGDLRRTDVAGARGVGMASVRIRAAHDDDSALPEGDHVAASHAELREILGCG